MSVTDEVEVQKSKGQRKKKHKISFIAVRYLTCENCNCCLQNADLESAKAFMLEHGGGDVPLKIVYEAVTDDVVTDEASGAVDQLRAIYELLRMAQTDTVAGAVKNWDAERQGMRELHDVNQAYGIYYRRLSVIVGMMENFLDMVDKAGALLLPPNVLALSASLRLQLGELSKQMVKIKLLL